MGDLASKRKLFQLRKIHMENKDVEIKSRIREVIQDRGGNASELARSMNITPAYLASVLNSQDKGVTATMFKGFAVINIDVSWLITGNGKMNIGDESGETLESWKMRAEEAQAELDSVQDSVVKLEYYIEQLERLNRNQ